MPLPSCVTVPLPEYGTVSEKSLTVLLRRSTCPLRTANCEPCGGRTSTRTTSCSRAARAASTLPAPRPAGSRASLAYPFRRRRRRTASGDLLEMDVDDELERRRGEALLHRAVRQRSRGRIESVLLSDHDLHDVQAAGDDPFAGGV